MKVEVSIDPEVKETKIIIVTDQMTDEISDLVRRLSAPHTDTITAYSDRGVVMIETKDILRIFTERKKVLLQTESGIYTVRSRLYELEEKLDNQSFVRISNSEIVNIRMITKMDISITGMIGVTFALSALLFDIARWSLLRQYLVHFVITSLVWIPIVMLLWMPETSMGTIILIISYLSSYVVTWLSQYYTSKKDIQQINETIQSQRLGSEDET